MMEIFVVSLAIKMGLWLFVPLSILFIGFALDSREHFVTQMCLFIQTCSDGPNKRHISPYILAFCSICAAWKLFGFSKSTLNSETLDHSEQSHL